MQTFVPLTNVHDCARALDRQRLGKQRSEAKQLLAHLLGEQSLPRPMLHHPIINMWRGYEVGLARYGVAICLEWINRGYRDTLLNYFYTRNVWSTYAPLPPWWGDDRVHASHRSMLIQKLPEHYRPIWPVMRDDLLYVWPEVHDDGSYTLRYSRADAKRLDRATPE